MMLNMFQPKTSSSCWRNNRYVSVLGFFILFMSYVLVGRKCIRKWRCSQCGTARVLSALAERLQEIEWTVALDEDLVETAGNACNGAYATLAAVCCIKILQMINDKTTLSVELAEEMVDFNRDAKQRNG